jgi:hypothetical protein
VFPFLVFPERKKQPKLEESLMCAAAVPAAKTGKKLESGS